MELLIATGGSPHSRMAIAYGERLAADLGAAVTLLCVTEGQRDCQQVFQDAAPLLAELGEYNAIVRHGHPTEEILRETEEQAYDMLVVGEKGHHAAVTSFLLGATAERVVTAARLPVLVVKGDPERPREGPIRRILLSVSLRRKAEDVAPVIRQARVLGAGTGAEVTVLHVMSQLPIPPAGAPEDWEASTTELLSQDTREGRLLAYVTSQLADAGVQARSHVRHGLVLEEILAESADGDYDLLIIGGHEKGTWLENLVLEDVAQRILHRARLPVLTVHSRRAAEGDGS